MKKDDKPKITEDNIYIKISSVIINFALVAVPIYYTGWYFFKLI